MKNQLEKILIVPDTHVPYHDKKAWELMLSVAKAVKVDHVITLGDLADFYGVSSHSKDPNRALKLEEEIEETKKAIGQLAALKPKSFVFIEGNHEDRLKRYLQDKAPELFHLVSTQKVLELSKHKIKFIPYKQSFKLGKMNFTHDVGNGGRFAAHKALDTFQHNIITGHTHRISYVVEGNAQGERHLSTTLGWLGDADAVDYMHKVKISRDWSLGFGIGYLDKKTGNVHVQPVPIVNYTSVVEGKLFKI